MGAPYSRGIHYPSPNLYTNGPAILLCLHFLLARLSRRPPLATKQVTSAVCHLQRSFKVADAFYIDGPITIATGAMFELEDWCAELREGHTDQTGTICFDVTPRAYMCFSVQCTLTGNTHGNRGNCRYSLIPLV